MLIIIFLKLITCSEIEPSKWKHVDEDKKNKATLDDGQKTRLPTKMPPGSEAEKKKPSSSFPTDLTSFTSDPHSNKPQLQSITDSPTPTRKSMYREATGNKHNHHQPRPHQEPRHHEPRHHEPRHHHKPRHREEHGGKKEGYFSRLKNYYKMPRQDRHLGELLKVNKVV